MPTVRVEIEVWCSCGEGLCNQSEDATGRKRGVIVEPCARCIKAARDEGYDKGYDDADKEADRG